MALTANSFQRTAGNEVAPCMMMKGRDSQKVQLKQQQPGGDATQ